MVSVVTSSRTGVAPMEKRDWNRSNIQSPALWSRSRGKLLGLPHLGLSPMVAEYSGQRSGVVLEVSYCHCHAQEGPSPMMVANNGCTSPLQFFKLRELTSPCVRFSEEPLLSIALYRTLKPELMHTTAGTHAKACRTSAAEMPEVIMPSVTGSASLLL